MSQKNKKEKSIPPDPEILIIFARGQNNDATPKRRRMIFCQTAQDTETSAVCFAYEDAKGCTDLMM